MAKYITNKELMAEIWKSKLSFCHSLDTIPEPVVTCSFDYSGDTLPDDMTGYVRHFPYEHIPTSEKKKGRQTNGIGHERVNFRPFKIYHDGQEIVRSHWTGGFANGHFSTDHGQINNRVGGYFLDLTKRYVTKKNFAGYSYRDEMEALAILQLTAGILTFDDSRSDNPFAYATQTAKNAFIRVINYEKKVQKLRDSVRISSGAAPSHSFENDASFEAAKERYWADKARQGISDQGRTLNRA